jgi:hypothetical protein
MKNIHLIPTYKPSRLHFDEVLFSSPNFQLSKTINSDVEGRNLYITSDEEIKEGDYVITPTNDIIQWAKVFQPIGKKIILTTDGYLIKDGVQAIDDKFLEWFVKNPSCEEVEVDKNWNYPLDKSWEYKIILPKKETKLKNICIKCGVDLYATEGRFTCQQSECRGIIVSKETLQEWADEEERKRHLIEIMKGDEELGVYDMSFGTRGCMYCKGNCNKECFPKQERVYEEPKNSGKTLADMKCSCLRYVPGSFSANCRNCGLSPRTDNNSINRVGTFCDKCRQVMCQCKPTQETKLTFIEWIGLFRWMGKGW